METLVYGMPAQRGPLLSTSDFLMPRGRAQGGATLQCRSTLPLPAVWLAEEDERAKAALGWKLMSFPVFLLLQTAPDLPSTCICQVPVSAAWGRERQAGAPEAAQPLPGGAPVQDTEQSFTHVPSCCSVTGTPTGPSWHETE